MVAMAGSGKDMEGFEMASQRLVEAALSGDINFVTESLKLETVDVNYIGTVSLSMNCIDSVLREDEADEIEVELKDFVIDVTPLYAAAHSGHVDIVRKLLSAGADVNQELFRGFATTAAAREGHCVLLDMLLKAGASQSACEDALLHACLYDKAEAAELVLHSNMVGHNVVKHALVSASCRGFVDVAKTLIKNGADINCTHRVHLNSLKPMLHANISCTPLAAAIVSRQVSMVKYLLEAGAKTNCLVKLGAWSWDIFSGEELRVGACLGEPYTAIWCAVEYYEASGQILNCFLQNETICLERQIEGRTLLCHAILCQNPEAVALLLTAGANNEFRIRTKNGHEFRPLHLAARIGCLSVLKKLILHGCQIDSRTETGDTALMLAAKADQANCFLELIISGADLGLLNKNGDSAIELAKKSAFGSSLAVILRQAIVSGKKVHSTNVEVFSLLHFVSGFENTHFLQMILQHSQDDIDKLDGLGLTPAMIAVKAGHIEAFRVLIDAGANISVKGRDGLSVVSFLQHHHNDVAGVRFKQIMLDAALAQRLTGYSEFKALHFSAYIGNLPAMVRLLEMGFPINSVDDSGHSPLMIAAKQGHADACKLLLQQGAVCGIANSRGETALFLARKSSKCKAAEGVIFDYLARSHVLLGEELWKYTRDGRGSMHKRVVQMLKSGLLTWGKTCKRNVICKEALAGPSESFLKNRRKCIDNRNRVVFRVITETLREIHFEASSAINLELWVHGINLITKEAAIGNWNC